MIMNSSSIIPNLLLPLQLKVLVISNCWGLRQVLLETTFDLCAGISGLDQIMICAH